MAVIDLQAVQTKPTAVLLVSTCVLWLCYLTVLAIHRLYFSALARFPGPKLAALTNWYEFYYELVQGGQFTFKIQELHEQYGGLEFAMSMIEH